MQQQKLTLVVAGLLVVALGALGAWYALNQDAPQERDITYELTALKDGVYQGDVPVFSGPVAFSSTFPEELRVGLQEKIEEDLAYVRQYPYDGNRWMNLALRYHTAGDYQSAERIWLFLAELPPVSVTVLNNLGRLYHFELKEYEKAEQYFTKAIEENPDRADAYFELFDLYRYSYKKDTSAAVDIMKQGMERFPDDINFPAGLGVYYRDTGRPNQARVQFEKALSMARDVGDMNLIQNFTNELSRL